MIANLPATEKQAFFGLLDEYFASRPHRLASATSASTATPARGGIGGLQDRATTAAGNAAGAAASVAVSNALRDQFARTGLGAGKAPPPPAPSANKKPGFSVPAGLTSGRALGSLNLGSRTISNTQVATTAAATTPARTLPPPARTGAAIPAPATTAAATSLPEGTVGSAKVLYDYGDGTDPDDLLASEGELIWLTEKISDDWWRGMSHDQSRFGIIPSAYVSASLS